MSSQKSTPTNKFRIRDGSNPIRLQQGIVSKDFGFKTSSGFWQNQPMVSGKSREIHFSFSPLKNSITKTSLGRSTVFNFKKEEDASSPRKSVRVLAPESPKKAFRTNPVVHQTLKSLGELRNIPNSLSPDTESPGIKPKFRKRGTSSQVGNHRGSQAPLSASPSRQKVPSLFLNQGFLEKAGVPFSKEEERKIELMSLNRFRLGKMLGEGAYSVVREAIDRENGQRVALKLYDKEKIVGNEKKRDNLASEIKVLASLKHPNIIRLFSFFETDSFVVLVMEFFEGRTLGEIVRSSENNFVTEFEARIIFREVLLAVHFCHRFGVIHRDLKMSNILVSNNLSVKLIDFGFSVMLTDCNRRLDLKCGTSYYMPPEIMKNLSYLGVPADIWSLGIVLFCITNGFYPFGAPEMSQAEIYKEISSGSLQFRKNLSNFLQDLIKQILRHDPMSRLSIELILQHSWMKMEEASPGIAKKNNKLRLPPPKK